MKNFLLVGGFDNTGGAGILADFKISTYLKTNPYCLIPVIAVQNHEKGFLNFPIPMQVLQVSLQAIFEKTEIEYCKIGMVGNLETAEFLAEFLSFRKVKIILDTPLKASNGSFLQSPEMIKPIAEKSFLITPNKEEFEVLNCLQPNFFESIKASVLIKSFAENENEIFDKLILKNSYTQVFSSKKINLQGNVRGTGCSLSSAICTFLFLGENLENAIQKGRGLIHHGLKNAIFQGKTGFLEF
jgi:hydroxymethylpyrimidine/phosphomethylpyrimidine kinase